MIKICKNKIEVFNNVNGKWKMNKAEEWFQRNSNISMYANLFPVQIYVFKGKTDPNEKKMREEENYFTTSV